ncbi:MAG: hypothetical protein HQK49_10935 [Oligoflexia bacterium]|nr:hypothetical protein [Oligoflexia bacterium]
MNKFIISLSFIVLLSSIAFAEEVIVIDSNDSNYPVGKKIDISSTAIKIAATSALKLISQKGEIIKLNGPHDGIFNIPKNPEKENNKLFAAVAKLADTKEKDMRSMGMVRASPPQAVADFHLLSIEGNSNQCIIDLTKAKFFRQNSQEQISVEITEEVNGSDANKKTAQKHTLEWEENNQYLSIPKNLNLQDGHLYRIRVAGTNISKKITFHISNSNSTSTNDKILEWLVEKGCTLQAESFLKNFY